MKSWINQTWRLCRRRPKGYPSYWERRGGSSTRRQHAGGFLFLNALFVPLERMDWQLDTRNFSAFPFFLRERVWKPPRSHQIVVGLRCIMSCLAYRLSFPLFSSAFHRQFCNGNLSVFFFLLFLGHGGGRKQKEAWWPSAAPRSQSVLDGLRCILGDR